jgi:hypothetical protein
MKSAHSDSNVNSSRLETPYGFLNLSSTPSTASHSFVATSSRRFSKVARGALMSGLSSFARVYIRLIIAREIVGVAIISFVSTGAICAAVWQMVG